MLENTYTLPQLIDLALRDPEAGAVNFNILHTVLQTIVTELHLESIQPWCQIESEIDEQISMLKVKMKSSPLFEKIFSKEDISKTKADIESAEKMAEMEQTYEKEEKSDSESDKESDFKSEPLSVSLSFEPEQAEKNLEEETKHLKKTESAIEFHDAMSEEESDDTQNQTQVLSEIWRATNIKGRMEAVEEAVKQLSFMMDKMLDRFEEDNPIVDQQVNKIPKQTKVAGKTFKKSDTKKRRLPITFEDDFETSEVQVSEEEESDYSVEDEDVQPIEKRESEHEESDHSIEDKDIEALEKPESEHEERDHVIEDKDIQVSEKQESEHDESDNLIEDIIQAIEKQESEHEESDYSIEHKEDQASEKKGSKHEESDKIKVIYFSRRHAAEKQGSEHEESDKIEDEDIHAAEKQTFQQGEKGPYSIDEDDTESSETQTKTAKKLEKYTETSDIVYPSKLSRTFSSIQQQNYDRVFEEIDAMEIKMEKLVESKNAENKKEVDQTLSEMEKTMKNVKSETESINHKLEEKEGNIKKNRLALEVVDQTVSEIERTIKIQNADIEDLYKRIDRDDTTREMKKNKETLDLKLDKIYFDATVRDIGEAIDGLVLKFVKEAEKYNELNNHFAHVIEEKLNISDFESAQGPLINRIRSLMIGFKRLKSIVMNETLAEAGAITKCLVCGRKAELTGGKYIKSWQQQESKRNGQFRNKNEIIFNNDDDSNKKSSSKGKKNYKGKPSLCKNCLEDKANGALRKSEKAPSELQEIDPATDLAAELENFTKSTSIKDIGFDELDDEKKDMDKIRNPSFDLDMSSIKQGIRTGLLRYRNEPATYI